jgi:hypothetical protein
MPVIITPDPCRSAGGMYAHRLRRLAIRVARVLFELVGRAVGGSSSVCAGSPACQANMAVSC